MKNRVEIIAGDVLEYVALAEVMIGVDAACYLIQSMSGCSEIYERISRVAINFATAKAGAGVQNVIFNPPTEPRSVNKIKIGNCTSWTV